MTVEALGVDFEEVYGLDNLTVKGKVLSAALELFTENGYFTTTIPQISRKANVSVGAIYHHFSDKQDIADCLFNKLTESLDIEFDRIEIKYANAIDRIKAVINLLIEITMKNPTMMKYMMTIRHSEFQSEGLTVCTSKPFVRMRNMVKVGMDRSEIKKVDVMMGTSAVFGPTMRMIRHALDQQLDKPLTHYLSDLADVSMCWIKL